MKELYEKIVKKGLERGFSEVEVYVVERATRSFMVLSEKISEAMYRESIHIGIRGALGRRVSGVYVNTTQFNIDDVLDKLSSAVKSTPEDPHWSGFPPVIGTPRFTSSFDERVITMSEEEYIELLKYSMENFKKPALAKGVEKAIITEGGLEAEKTRITVINSHGVARTTDLSSLHIGLSLSIEKSGLQADKSVFYSKSVLNEKELEKVLVEEGERALFFLGSKPIESGIYDVILEPLVTGAILTYSLAQAFSALEIIEGRSPLRGREGSSVFNDKINIIDDPYLEGALGTRSFDDEGVVTSNKPIVERGVFKNALHSYYTAMKTASTPTGNGFRRSPAAQPTPRFTNILLRPGSGSLEEFMRDLRRGIVVYEVIGYWMSDYTSGSVKATITHGLLIENGVITRPVKGVVLGGNIYEWLSKNIVEVGGDIRVIGDTATPSLWISNVRIGGE
jgi:PmbA protein